MSFLNQAFLFSLARHALQAGGVWLIAKGYTDQSGVDAIIGGALSLGGVVWSAITHRST